MAQCTAQYSPVWGWKPPEGVWEGRGTWGHPKQTPRAVPSTHWGGGSKSLGTRDIGKGQRRTWGGESQCWWDRTELGGTGDPGDPQGAVTGLSQGRRE